jgi:hypothetical protein
MPAPPYTFPSGDCPPDGRTYHLWRGLCPDDTGGDTEIGASARCGDSET